MPPKRARTSHNNDAGMSKEHQRLTAKEKGKAPIQEQQEDAVQERAVARATQEVDPTI